MLFYCLCFYCLLTLHESRIVAGCRQPHKGPRDITNNAQTSGEKKPKKKSQVAARRDELMGEQSPTEPAPIVQRSKDMRTEQQKNDVIAWVRKNVTLSPNTNAVL